MKPRYQSPEYLVDSSAADRGPHTGAYSSRRVHSVVFASPCVTSSHISPAGHENGELHGSPTLAREFCTRPYG